MFKIISPDSFKPFPWKNGKGTTTELAINEGGNLEHFDWRLSIASVVEDGEFSNFAGYQRNLILIKGQGIDLEHDGKTTDNLSALLSIASFDGQCRTTGRLHNGAIDDFNIITRADKIDCKVETWLEPQTRQFEFSMLNFVFSFTDNTHVGSTDEELNFNLPQRHLARVESINDEKLIVTGAQVIYIGLEPIN